MRQTYQLLLVAVTLVGMAAGCNQKASQSMDMNGGTKPMSMSMYTCPMHPEVASDHAGKCPKCGMDLVAKK